MRQVDLLAQIRERRIPLVWAPARLAYGLPNKTLRRDKTDGDVAYLPRLAPYLERARSEIILVSPYFVPGNVGTARLADLCAKDVRIRVLTNSLASNDVAVVLDETPCRG